MRKTRWLWAALALLALPVSGVVLAAASEVKSAPSMAERLQTARKLIDDKVWRNAGLALEQALREEPANPDVLNLLGYFNRKKPAPDLNKAFDFYKRALAIDPNHKGAHEYIGEAYLMAEQPDEARQHLSRLEAICASKTCEEYEDLEKAIARYQAAPRPAQ